MANDKFASVLHYIRRIAGTPAGEALTDRQLLQSFAADHDEAAFTTLVQRHAALVWGVCLRVLGRAQDAEDAFQATFLVLARKAGRVRWHQDVGNWLYAVALRTALKAKAGVTRRQRQERQIDDMPAREAACDAGWSDIRPVLDEELSRLPHKYRTPLVLHYLEGKTYAQAAQILGWPKGTVSTRLTRAREMLRTRLARRGLALSAGLLGTAFSQDAAPAALLQATVKAALLVSAAKALAAGLVSVRVATLTEGVLKAMFLSKLKIAAGLLLVVGLAGAGTGVVFQRTQAGPAAVPGADKPAQAQAAEPLKEGPLRQEVKRLKEENDRLHLELRDLREQVTRLERKIAPPEKADQQVLYQGKPAAYWIKKLKDLDPKYRAEAIGALGFIGQEDRGVIPVIARSLKDRDDDVRQAAGNVLSTIGKDAVPALIASLKDKNDSMRRAGVNALCMMGAEAKDAVPALIASLKDPDARVRHGAVLALGRIRMQARATIAALIEALKDEDETVRSSASDTLRTMPLDLRALTEALKNKDPMVRVEAASLLAYRIKTKAAFPLLVKALKTKNDEEVRMVAPIVALSDRSSSWVPALIKDLEDKDPAVRVVAATALGAMGAKSATPALVKALEDRDEHVRKAAAEAYRVLNPTGRTDKRAER